MAVKSKVIRIVLPEDTGDATINALVEEVMDFMADMRIAGVTFVSEEDCADEDPQS